MPATSITEDLQKEELEDDISQVEVKKTDDSVDINKLAALKAKIQAKQENNMLVSNMKKDRSLEIGVLGSGQAGSRIAEAMFKLGYNAIACNTAIQDLKFINIPDSNKLLLNNGIGGSSKEISIGAAAAEMHRQEILDLVNDKLSTSQVNMLCLSLGGGSGAGSCETIVSVLEEVGKPIVVMAVLPMDSDDVKSKANSLETLSKLSDMTKNKRIANLICVDNAKIESIYSHVGQMDFYNIANDAIVEPLDVFNVFSSQPSSVKALDGMELVKLLIGGEGLSTYGHFNVENFTDDTAVAEAVINNLSNNLLASHFNLKQSRFAGFLLIANKEVWAQIPSSSINYSVSVVNDLCGNPEGVFKGLYVDNSTENVVKVYSWFAGLGMPIERLDQLKNETKELQLKVKAKDDARNLTLQLDTGKNEAVSAAQKVKDKIAQKSSTFGKFISTSVVDRRK
jgi:cell division GTPase FtsZ